MTACQSPSLTIFSGSITWFSSTVDTDRSEMSESLSLNADVSSSVPPDQSGADEQRRGGSHRLPVAYPDGILQL